MQEIRQAYEEFKEAVEEAIKRGKARVMWAAVMSMYSLTMPNLWPIWIGIAYMWSNQDDADAGFDSESLSAIEAWADSVNDQWGSEVEIG